MSLGSRSYTLATSTSTRRSFIYRRSVPKSENRIPDWLIEILDERCPGFMETGRELTPKAAKNRPRPLRFEEIRGDSTPRVN